VYKSSFLFLQNLTDNGQTIELVNVAERLEAVTRKALLFRAESRHTAGRSEAWRGFCLPIAIGTGTIFVSYKSVVVQFVLEPEICHGILNLNCEQWCVSG
jgi:hypothetical protein